MTTEFIVIIIGGILMWLTPILGVRVSSKLARRVLWGFFTVLILGFMFWGISGVKEKTEKENKQAEEINKLQFQIDYLFKKNYEAQHYQVSVEFSNIATMTATARVTHPNGQVDLKDRAEDLFLAIGKFLAEREGQEPCAPNIETFEADIGKIFSYYQDTVRDYSSKFGPEVIAIRNELASNGKQDKELDKYYKHPSDPDEMWIVAKRIKALGDQ